MAGYLDTYGVADERRERIVKRIFAGIGIAILLAVISLVVYFSTRNRSQERVVSQFLEDLNHQQYMAAYKLWGCPDRNCHTSRCHIVGGVFFDSKPQPGARGQPVPGGPESSAVHGCLQAVGLSRSELPYFSLSYRWWCIFRLETAARSAWSASSWRT